MENRKNKYGVKEIVVLGMFCAVAYAVMLLSKLIPVNVLGFLSLDFKDVIIAVSGFMFGPVPALIVSVIVSIIEMLTVSSTGPIGLLMNVLSTCAFVIPSALMYRSVKKFKGAVLGLIIGVLCMTAVMLLWNWIITPLYMGIPRQVIVTYLLPIFLPFNLVKGALNAAITMLIYKPIVTALRKARLISASKSESSEKKTGLTVAVTLISIFVIVSLVLVFLAWQGVI